MSVESRQKLLNALSNESETVISLAYMYAHGFDLCGDDVTKAWVNASQNTKFIEDIYRKGYEDAFKDMEEKKRKDFYHKALVDLKI